MADPQEQRAKSERDTGQAASVAVPMAPPCAMAIFGAKDSQAAIAAIRASIAE